MDWLHLAGKTAVITGGGAGIGYAIAAELLADGANVVICDINPQKPQVENATEDNFLYVVTDVTSASDVQNALDQTVKTFGRVDALINNAGINIPCLLVDPVQNNSPYELSEAIWDKVIGINCKGVFLCAQSAARRMIQQKIPGVIINMSSECGLEGSEGQSVYAASKNAVNAMTRSWCKELGQYGIRVVGIAPGIMEATNLRTQSYEEALAYTRGKTVEQIREGYKDTKTTPLGRSGKLSEVASTVAFLISDKASYINGVTLNVAGGKTRG